MRSFRYISVTRLAVALLVLAALLSACSGERIVAGQYRLEPIQDHEGTMANGDYIYIAKEFRFHGTRIEPEPGESLVFLAVDNPKMLVMRNEQQIGRAVWIGDAEISGQQHHAMILALPKQVVEHDDYQVNYAR